MHLCNWRDFIQQLCTRRLLPTMNCRFVCFYIIFAAEEAFQPVANSRRAQQGSNRFCLFRFGIVDASDSEPDVTLDKKGTNDALGQVDLSTPLRSDELLKNPTHRVVATPSATASPAGIVVCRSKRRFASIQTHK